MKKLLFTLCPAALVAILATSCGTKPEATIDGTVTGVADGTIVYLYNSARTKVDSVAVADGAFRFDIPKAYPDVAYLLVEGVGRPQYFFVEPGALTATVDAAATPPAIVISGTPTNDGKRVVDDKNADAYEQYKAVTAKLSSAEGTPEYDALLAEYYRLEEQSEQNIKDAVMAAPGTVLAAFFVYNSEYGLRTPEMVDSVLTIVADAPANAFSDHLRKRRDVLAKTAIGQPAPDFTENQPDGTIIANDLRGAELEAKVAEVLGGAGASATN